MQHQKICTDTRKVKPGDIFLALKGDRFNGNTFAAKALDAGAVAVVVDEEAFCEAGDPRYILVEDGLRALQDLSRAYRRTLEIPFLGITGSNGKTTTKELVHAVLSTAKKTFATQGNYNNHIGVPLTLLSIPQDTEIAIIEMGANKPGDIKELVEIAEPTHGLITNVGRAHLEGMGSLEGVQKTKGELFDFLRANNGQLFVNRGDERVSAAAGQQAGDISFGTDESNYRIELKEHQLEGMELLFHAPDQEVLPLQTQLTGVYNATNVLVAAMVGDYFGVPRSGIQKGVYGYRPTNNRSEIIQKGAKTIVLDAYNANPSSMRAAIRNVFSYADKKVLLILGDMLEMGAEEAEIHAELGRFVNQFPAVCTICVGTRMQAMADVLKGEFAWFKNAEKAADAVHKWQKITNMVLIKGSRGMALESLVGKIES
ncbi:MAG: UDP-N-acetylmuramoyl-tripeptide--D-alanyl-D-alanine ligase [Bacteroidota bacterium]